MTLCGLGLLQASISREARVVPLLTVNERLNEALAAICDVANAVYSAKAASPSAFNYYSEAIWGQIQIMSAQYQSA
jgi:hypothetical protein